MPLKSAVNFVNGRLRDQAIARMPKGASAAVVAWKPFTNSPQQMAYESTADEIYYGGAAGGGKTELLLGVAGTQAKTAIIFRRVFPNLRAIIERSREIYNAESASAKDSYNESLHIWRLATGAIVEFGAIQYEKDWVNFRGRPHDFYGWDEISEFTENQYRFVNAWNRSAVPGQRCRIIATGNPPTATEGVWVLKYWGAWLDKGHRNPAAPGELVWYVRLDDKDVEVGRGNDRPDPIEHKGQTLTPRSRTFIPAKLEDNPILLQTGYAAVLDGLPEPLRSQMRYGVFGLETADNPYQILPTKWVELAQERWTPQPASPLIAIGVDPARGGEDATAIALRHGDWFEVKAFPGVETPDGATVAQLVLPHWKDGIAVPIDVIGVGSSPYDCLVQMGISAVPLNASEASKATDKTGKIGFKNKRAEWHWKLREALDPESGSTIALPPSETLKADLCAARWQLTGWKIQVESKADIKVRLGRSPNEADALMYALNVSVETHVPGSLAFTRKKTGRF